MNVLDENIADHQRDLLRRWRIAVRHVGHDIGRMGMSDQEIIPLLHGLRRPTLFTRDTDFYRPRLCHAGYCLVWLHVKPVETAEYVRRVLRHPDLDTQAKRMGTVIEAAPAGLTVWRIHEEEPVHLPWPTKRRR